MLSRARPTLVRMPTVTLPKPRGFRLDAAQKFYASFTPGSGMAAVEGARLTLAFRLDRTFEPVVVALDDAPNALAAEYAGTRDGESVVRQVSRILGLDADGDAWRAIGERDPVVGMLQSEFPGFFTAAKSSPYDAATWSVIAPRMNMNSAASLKMSIAEKRGDAVTLGGRVHHLFPGPEAVARIEPFPGLPEEKRERLRGVARVALEGRLGADRLRAMKERDALEELMTLRGIGPWAASHILYRGAALQDALPTAEPRVLHGFGAAYGMIPNVGAFERMAKRGRPFRMWVCILLSRHLARMGGWHAPSLGRERAAAGRLQSPRSPRIARPMKLVTA
jgi:3-methyladenine DNA glycosylase/8-oxoguanine DNA glycosylase